MHSTPPDPEALRGLSQSRAWAESLAKRLVGDEHLAEDVVQDAWLASLRSATPARLSRGWLAGTIRNLSLGERRDRARRRARERIASRAEALPAASESLERLEAQEMLLAALLAIEEPFQSALIARHVEGLNPLTIAKRDGVPVATVNSRLARGMKRLRAELHSSHRDSADPTRWIAALVPLLRPAAPQKTALALGVVTMKKLCLATVAILALIPLGKWAQDTLSPPEVPTTEGRLESDAPLAGAAESLAPVAATGNDPMPSARTELDRSPPTEVPNRALTPLQVVDFDLDEPVAGASIYIVPSREAERVLGVGDLRSSAAEFPAALRDFCRQSPTVWQTDASGLAQLELPGASALAFAVAGNRFGFRTVHADSSEQVLHVGLDRTLVVEVTDSKGQLLPGIPVRLTEPLAVDDDSAPSPSYTLAMSVTKLSDGGAKATLSLSHTVFSMLDQNMLEVSVHAPAGPLASASPRKSVYLDRWPTEPIRLQLEPSGSVLVELMPAPREISTALGDGSLVQLGEIRSQGHNESLFADARGALLTEGRARFEPVPPGAQIAAAIWPTDGGPPFVTAGTGPSAPHQEAVLTVDPWAPWARVTGRVVTEAGAPVANARLDAQLGRTGWLLDALHTDAKGQFEWRVDLGEVPFAGADLLVVQPAPDYGSARVPGNKLQGLASGARAANGAVRMGDIVLQRPVPQVAAAPQAPPPNSFASPFGTLLVDAGVPASRITVEVWPLARGELPPSSGISGWKNAAVEDDGSFRFQRLKPGAYALRAGMGEEHENAVIVPEVFIDAGDQELAPIDLRGFLRVFDCRVVNQEGYRLEATVSMMQPITQRGQKTYAFPRHIGRTDRKRSIVYVAREGMRLLIEAKDYFPTVVDPGVHTGDITLERGFPIRLDLASHVPVSEIPGDLIVELLPTDASTEWPKAIRAALEHRSLSKAVVRESGSAVLSVPRSGEYTVRASIAYDVLSGYRIKARLRPDSPLRLTVRNSPTDDPARYELALETASLDVALARVKKIFQDWVDEGRLRKDLKLGEVQYE